MCRLQSSMGELTVMMFVTSGFCNPGVFWGLLEQDVCRGSLEWLRLKDSPQSWSSRHHAGAGMGSPPLRARVLSRMMESQWGGRLGAQSSTTSLPPAGCYW